MTKTDHFTYTKCENSTDSGEEEAGRLLSSFFPFLLAKVTSLFNSQELHQVKAFMEQGRPTPVPEESSSSNNFEWQQAQEISNEF